jgi:Xaa-Pro dipeptidase
MFKTLNIAPAEFGARSAALLAHLRAGGLTGVVLFDRTYILYYTGFAFIPTERPIAFVLNAAGERALFVPRLELEHAQAGSTVERAESYVEYPGDPHPLRSLARLLGDMGIGDVFAADSDGPAWALGYQGPALSELAGSRPRPVAPFVESQMMVKSPAELALIRASATWGNLAHALLQRYTRPGLTETEVGRRASTEATLALLDAIGPIYQSQSPYWDGASATYRGQIGRGASIPGALAGNVTFRAGDVLISEARAPIWGYDSELERTLLLGPAGDEAKRLFEQMLALQETALGALRPGAACADVDRAVRAEYERRGLLPYWRHHAGHAIGLRYHEGPFLDVHDPTLLRPGMVFTVEPGLYVAGLGGFRHSDTVVVTEAGVEAITYYPRDLESLTIPA